MAIIRCEKGHYYDNEKFAQCPHCGIFAADEDEKTVAVPPQGMGAEADDEKTVAMRPAAPRTPGTPAAASYGVEQDDKTVSLYADEKGADFIVGWLVCVEGPERGRDYRLHQGFNRIGRDYALDVVVVDDTSVSREAACAVVYDDRSNRFFAVQQTAGEAYLNGQAISGAVDLKTGDVIRTGNSEFEFVAFCREGRVWEND